MFDGGGGADGGVVLVGLEAGKGVGVAGGEPAEAESGEAVGFGEAGEGEGVGKESGGGGQGFAVGFEAAVHFIGEETGAGAGDEIDEGLPLGGGEGGAGGVMGEIDDDEGGIVGKEGFEIGEGEMPLAIFFAGLPEVEVAAEGAGDFVKGLVAGEGNDDVVTGGEEGAHGEVDGLFGDGGEDVVGGEAGIVVGDGGAEDGVAGGFGVAEGEVVPDEAVGGGGVGEEFGEGEGFAVGTGKEVGGGELVAGEVAFEGEGAEGHPSDDDAKKIARKSGGGALRNWHMMWNWTGVAGMAFAFCLLGQEPGRGRLEKAYELLRAGALEGARGEFEAGLEGEPGNMGARLDYGYLLLRMGETERGREEMERVMKAKPEDERLAMEYAYLAYETGRRAEAFTLFLRLSVQGRDEGLKREAGERLARIDGELQAGIARWREAVRRTPESYSVHEELGRLLEERNAWVEAGEEYREAYRLKPDKKRLLLDIARVEEEALRPDYGHAALIAASRGGPAMVAEEAREKMPGRYPYVYEFEMAIRMDPLNVELRRELGFLLLKMGREKEAVGVFEGVLRLAPEDALATAQLAFLRVKRGVVAVDTGLTAVEELATKSLEKGYLKDALKYLQQLHEANPEDAATTLRLGWTYNMLKLDREAVKCFDLARRSGDGKVAGEAERAYRNLAPSLRPVRVTAWMLPFYSRRWRETFGYGQVKAEFRTPLRGVRPYVSARLIGDLGRGRGLTGPAGQAAPGALSESAVVLGAGLVTERKRGWMAWGEAGGSWQYFAKKFAMPTIRSDYRGGVNYAKAWGAANLGSEGGWFGASTFDGVFLSRFGNNTLFYGQNRVGWHVGGAPVQVYVNLNLTGDVLRTDWANFAEVGPGVRWKAPGMPAGLYLFADAVYGRHLVRGGTRDRRYIDVRAGVWYAFTY